MKYLPSIIISSLLVGVGIAAETPTHVPRRANWGLYSHESIVIDRPAADVWPLIVDTDQWKRALQHQRVNGAQGEIGEVVAESIAKGQAPLFYCETVELVPNVRRTIKLYAPNRGPLIGFASWELEESKGKTRVTYHVYSETLISTEELEAQTPDQIAVAQKQTDSQNRARFRAELVQLKHLAEASTPVTAPNP
jgi:uncharacterized protein YndB with AHSA1/START domain